MNIKAFERLLAMLPEGPRKQDLAARYLKIQKNSTKRGGDGLQDSFEFQPKGHIKIEAIDEKGRVVGTLADQPNLVVDGAEEILLRALSGDPNRILYKNRVPKVTPTAKIHIEDSKLAGSPLFSGSQLLHDPNVIWSAVNDDDFTVSYGFYPVVTYIKEEPSTEVGKKAFKIATSTTSGYVPMNAEIYSTYTNLFIGIGEGENYEVDLADTRLTYSEGFAPANGKATTTVVDHEISFSEKISNFAIEYEASNTGAQIDVFINGALRETIEAGDSGLASPEVRKAEYKNLDNQAETVIRIVHSGTGVQSMTITGLYFDALSKDMNGLIKEFKNFEVDFLTPTTYNTTPMGPYTIQLPSYPVKDNSVVVSYNDLTFTEVETADELTDTTFIVDETHGLIQFNRALTGIIVTYSATGEVYETALVSTMVSSSVNGIASNNFTAKFAVKTGTVKILDQNGVALTLAAAPEQFGNGKFILDQANNKLIKMAKNDALGQPITKVEIVYMSDERPGIPTNYTRAVIEKPKSINEYPWFELDKGSVRFVAEFPELKPSHNITIREMGLFDGPRVEDNVPGFRKYPVKAFSLVRVGETRKDINTGIRITWTITLLNSDGLPFQGGSN